MFVCIVGTSRCGTTLLRQMMHEHPDLVVFRETHWLPKLVEFFGMQ
ncbi:MAG: sulfotransferase, partial [Candidatus Binatia bacterium]